MPKFKQTRPLIGAGFPNGHPTRTETAVFEVERQPICAPWPAVPVSDDVPLHDWEEDKETFSTGTHIINPAGKE